MPTYDYACDACDHTFELYQSFSEPVQRDCPSCGKPKLRRLFGTGAAIIFKGSGFYQTDYRSESYRQGAAADKPAEAGKKADKSSDSGSKSKGETSAGAAAGA